jgi:hypothetical protein
MASAANAENNWFSELRYGASISGTGRWPRENQERDSLIEGNFEAVLKTHYGMLGGELHPNVGLSISLNRYQHQNPGASDRIYAGGLLIWEVGRVFFDTGLGLTVHEGSTPYYGTSILSHEQLDLGIRLTGHYGIGIFYQHMSNDEIETPNVGLNSIGVWLTYRF